jgi:Na+/H+ antiporter NhaD/arsenite permease-like protein
MDWGMMTHRLGGWATPPPSGGSDLYWKSMSLPMGITVSMPFILMLGSIAVLPLAFPHWWESNRNKAWISLALGAPTLAYLLSFVPEGPELVLHTAVDYLAFVTLLTALFVIAGGIYIRGTLAGTPLTNTVLLGIGAVAASFIGTTGASMVLIRPLLRANHRRRHKVHTVIFFIFIVSNCGGLLTPLGDPPLFLGFLRGVPFHWTFRLFAEWALVNGVLLLVYNLLDQYWLNREELEDRRALLEEIERAERPIAIEGRHNFVYLAGVMGTILLVGYMGRVAGWSDIWQKIVQTAVMAGLALLAWWTTPRRIYEHNHFTFHPPIEVAVVFGGIFATMVPVLQLLAHWGDRLGVVHPWQFFWMTGVLSSFLDNAPTYLTFASLASGLLHTDPMNLAELTHTAAGESLLRAISCGAVFMGANTYIGNAPNFMVRAIAEEQRIRMPSFLGYLRWSVPFLVPLWLLVTLVFFRG